MVDRVGPVVDQWVAVDDYIVERLVPDHPREALAVNAAAGLPDIDVSAAQGKLLHLLARIAGASRILEVGTLGGYSTIWLARAVGEGGQVVSLELEPHHAEVAVANLAREGLVDRVDIRVGPAIESLRTLESPFDFVFIDADKPSNVVYLNEAVRLSRPGTTIIVDNVMRDGEILDCASTDPRVQGTRALFDAVAANPRLSATAIQTVGLKRWDGFLMAVVGA